MLQTLNCIRMGEVLLDENLQLFILCNNCHTDLRNVQDFRQHLEKCEGLENLLRDGQQLKYNTDKSTQLFGKTNKGLKEFLIYDYTDVEMTYLKPDDHFIDLINIEEELLDPKWYSDLNVVEVNNTSKQKSSQQYDELVEAVTPFVQFKENLKTNNNNSGSGNQKSIITKTNSDIKTTSNLPEKSIKNVKFDLPPNKMNKPAVKRRLSMAKSIPIQLVTQSQGTVTTLSVSQTTPATTTMQVNNNTLANKRRKTQQQQVTLNGSSSSSKPPLEIHQIPILTSNNPITHSSKVSNKSTVTQTQISTNMVLNPLVVIPTSTITTEVAEPTKEKQTAQILNKLQNLGLQVKRTQPLPPPPPANPAAAANRTDTKTLEILQKLQSKGMKVKILNKQQTPAMAKPLPPAIVSNPLQKPSSSLIRNPTATTNIAIKQNLNKNLIIRKVN